MFWFVEKDVDFYSSVFIAVKCAIEIIMKTKIVTNASNTLEAFFKQKIFLNRILKSATVIRLAKRSFRLFGSIEMLLNFRVIVLLFIQTKFIVAFNATVCETLHSYQINTFVNVLYDEIHIESS